MRYRAEIDGLRALAVVPVILFHGGFGWPAGGYVGVDVFFVITGYLMTSMLLEDKAAGRLSVVGFYVRRARRILPALTAVLSLTTLAAYLLLPPHTLTAYSQSLASVAVFASNVFFFFASGYFSDAAETAPLLHTWSLAVEEQFYLVFPLLVVLPWLSGRRRLASAIAVLAFGSLVCSVWLWTANAHSANFYLIFGRAWEMLLGALVALMGTRGERMPARVRETAGVIGLLLIGYAVVGFDARTPFPGPYALVPTVGAALILLGADAGTHVGRWLSVRPLVLIGLMSYSLYLWHQPVFAFIRLKTPEAPPDLWMATAIVPISALAFVTWRYVERPFRDRARVSSRAVTRFAGASIGVFVVLGMAGHVFRGFEGRYGELPYADSMRPSPLRAECHTEGADYLWPADACRYFVDNATWAVLGDSTVVEPGLALAEALADEGEGVLHLSFSACQPALWSETRAPGCRDWLEEAVVRLEKDAGIRNILIGFRYLRWDGGHGTGPRFDKSADVSDRPEARAAWARYWREFAGLVERLSQAGKTLYVLYPIPELPMDIRQALAPFSIFGGPPLIDPARALTADGYRERFRYVIDELDRLPYGQGLYAVRPFDILCAGAHCPAAIGGKALYYDDYHLSLWGAQQVVDAGVLVSRTPSD